MDRLDRAAQQELLVRMRALALAGVVGLTASLISCGSPAPSRPGELASTCPAVARRDAPRSAWYAGRPHDGLILALADDDARGSRRANGTLLQHTHTDVARQDPDGTLSLRRAGSRTNLPVIEGGACGITTFRDGNDSVTLAPTAPDASSAQLMDGADGVGGGSQPVTLASGLTLLAVQAFGAAPARPRIFWSTGSHQFVAGDGERSRGLSIKGVQVVVFGRSHLLSMSTPSPLKLSALGRLPDIAEVSTSDALATYVALLPATSHHVSMQLDPPTGSASTGQGLVMVRPVPGTPYLVAAVGPVPAGSSSLVLRWMDKSGKSRTWSTH